MKVVATNIGSPKKLWNGKKYITTGILKEPVGEGIFLDKTDVRGDAVMDRKYHGGIDKACYLYSTDHYPFWQKKYPDLDWRWGMLGENISIKGLQEDEVFIGDQYTIGDAVIEISEPRRPCATLGLRFENKAIIREFLEAPFPGTYARVINAGHVQTGDEMILRHRPQERLTIAQVYSLFSSEKNNEQLALSALALEKLSEDCKQSIRKHI